MSFDQLVLVKPSEVCFTRHILEPKFDNGIPLMETVTQLQNGEILSEDIPLIEIVWYYEKSAWYTLDNRRLWVFKELEKLGEVVRIKAQRVEAIENIMDFPTKLYKSASLRDERRENRKRKNRSRDDLTIHTTRTEEVEIECSRRGRSRSKSKEIKTVVHDRHRGMTYEERVSVKCDYREYRRSKRRDDKEQITKRRTSSMKAQRKSFTTHNRFDPRKHSSRSLSNEKDVCVRDRSVSLYGYRVSPLTTSSQKQIRVLPRHLTDAGIFFRSHFHYEGWKLKRSQFFQGIFSGGHASAKSRALETLYTCGVCFKSFKARVSLDQHSEELMHWACIRCGRFFGSFTALGQHKRRLGHVA